MNVNPYEYLIEQISIDARDVVVYAHFDQDNRIVEMNDECPLEDMRLPDTFADAVDNLRLAFSNVGVSVEEAVLGLLGMQS